MNIFRCAQLADHNTIYNFIKNTDEKIDVNIHEIIRGFTPLILLITSDNAQTTDGIKTLELLVGNGADVNLESYDGCSPLRTAVINNLFEIVKLLILFDADPNIQNSIGYVPLTIASEHGYTDIVEYLLPLTNKKHYQLSFDVALFNGKIETLKKIQTYFIDNNIILSFDKEKYQKEFKKTCFNNRNAKTINLIKTLCNEFDINLIEPTSIEYQTFRRGELLVIDNEVLRGLYFIADEYVNTNIDDFNELYPFYSDMDSMKESPNNNVPNIEVESMMRSGDLIIERGKTEQFKSSPKKSQAGSRIDSGQEGQRCP